MEVNKCHNVQCNTICTIKSSSKYIHCETGNKNVIHSNKNTCLQTYFYDLEFFQINIAPKGKMIVNKRFATLICES